MADAKKLIEENLKTKNPYLDLGNCGLDGTEEYLSLLSKCTHLKTLILSETWLEYDEEKVFWSEKESQNINDGSNNQIKKIPPYLPINLEKLAFSGGFNQSIDISFLENLKKLQNLYLQVEEIKDISIIWKLIEIENLCLISEGEKEFNLSGIESLKGLESLYLSLEEISDINDIILLSKLKGLYLESDGLANISGIKHLITLKGFYLRSEGVTNISNLYDSDNYHDASSIAGLGFLENLQVLDLQSNSIHDISFLETLKSLNNLNLSFNSIRNISSLKGLKKLKRLHLYSNHITNISLDFITALPNLEYLEVHNNPIKNIPEEIFNIKGDVLEDVKNFLAASELTSYLHEGKMILVGNGEVGKTSIRLKLLDKKARLPEKENRTQGLDLSVDTYKIKNISPILTGLKQEVDFDLHIWDFGGQGRYREVQQLFCSRKSLYLFVTAYDDKPHQEDYVGFEYWLSMINAFNFDPDAKRHSPVIHVLNKIDKEATANFNESRRKELFPNIQVFCKISALNLQNFESLEEGIKKLLPFVSKDIFRTFVPKTWSDIKNVLMDNAKKGKTHILWKDYLSICTQKDVNESSAGTLIRTLDRMGYVIYYGNHPQLKNWIILNPLWVKDAIYKVLDSDLIQDAKFFPKQFRYVWNEYETPKPIFQKLWEKLIPSKKYTNQEHQKLLALMLAYEFCYEQKDNRGNPYYIIPALFGNKPSLPENLQSFDYEIKFEYNPFIPAGTVNKLMVRLHESIHKDLKWKNGVIFIDDTNFAFAEVQEVWEEKTVYLKLKGQTVKPLYNRIYQTLLDLNQQLKDTKFLKTLNFKTWVQYKGSWLSLKEVINFEIKDYDFVLRGSLEKEGKNAQNIADIQSQVDELISEYELEKATQLLIDYLKGKSSELFNQVNSIPAALKRLERDKPTLSRKEFIQEENGIIQQLNTLKNALEDL